MEDFPFCSIVIPAFNEEAVIEKSLKTIVSQNYPRNRYEVILVDNGSTDETSDIAKRFCDRVVSKPDGHVGEVRNYGISLAKGSVIVCTDSDCQVDPEWLGNGVQLLKQNAKCAFGGGLKLPSNATWVEKYWILNDKDGGIQQRDLMGSSIFCWKQDFEKVKGFNEQVTSGEDTDLSQKLRASGIKIILEKELSVIHLGNAKNVTTFFSRQMWHSENYLSNIKSSISDPTFILISINLIALLTIIIAITAIQKNYFLIQLFSSLFLIIPAVFSAKRLYRAKIFFTRIKDIPFIYIIDLLYVNARTLGLAIGIIKTLKFIKRRH